MYPCKCEETCGECVNDSECKPESALVDDANDVSIAVGQSGSERWRVEGGGWRAEGGGYWAVGGGCACVLGGGSWPPARP